MRRVLIAYDTTEGQTQKIAERMCDFAREMGFEPTVLRIRKTQPDLNFDLFDMAIVGGSLHVGQHSVLLERFVIDFRAELERIPSAFFSVSLSAAGTDGQRAEARHAMEEFLKQTGWAPRQSETVAGALLYREYPFWKRWLMKMMAQRAGGDTDTSKNHEYTDWAAVQQFVTNFLVRAD
jgi:menaquinone-dependent protoporphyrinogen oxidase